MSTPTTLAKIWSGLQRLGPRLKSLQSPFSFLGAEWHAAAVTLAMANDIVEAFFDELFPATATQLIERYESVYRVPSRPNDDIDARRARVLIKVQRANGPQLDKLAAMLAPILDVNPSDIVFVEQLRSNIDNKLTVSRSYGLSLSTIPARFKMGCPWPGVIDDLGVRVSVATTALTPNMVVKVRHPNRSVSWSFTPAAASTWTSNRTDFLGLPAGGQWLLEVSNPDGGVLDSISLGVSNDVDDGQIYNFILIRDPSLEGTPYLVEAQQQFSRYALGHMNAVVAERHTAIADDVHSIADRDPVGV